MDELIARLEAATAADFSLNKDIALALGWHTTGEKHPTGTGWTALWDEKGVIRNRLPNWVGSLDAALTLVPEGAYWTIGSGKIRPDEPLYGVMIRDPQTMALLGEAETNGSAALALCIACLRARSHTAPQEK